MPLHRARSSDRTRTANSAPPLPRGSRQAPARIRATCSTPAFARLIGRQPPLHRLGLRGISGSCRPKMSCGLKIDKIPRSTHRDFGPLHDGVQERYLSYYGIRRAIRDGATLEVHYIRDPVPLKVEVLGKGARHRRRCNRRLLSGNKSTATARLSITRRAERRRQNRYQCLFDFNRRKPGPRGKWSNDVIGC